MFNTDRIMYPLNPNVKPFLKLFLAIFVALKQHFTKTKIPGFLGPGYKFVINQQLTLPGHPIISLVAWCL
jgi:hypothetical protein